MTALSSFKAYKPHLTGQQKALESTDACLYMALRIDCLRLLNSVKSQSAYLQCNAMQGCCVMLPVLPSSKEFTSCTSKHAPGVTYSVAPPRTCEEC